MSLVDEARTSETELKFELAAEALTRLKRHPALAAGAGPAERLRSVYFDTPDHDLRNAGLSLRVRERDGRFVQTVKTRAGAGLIERGEWEMAVARRRPDARSLANTPAAQILDGHIDSLEPVFSTTVERAIRMCDVGGARVEVSLDRGEIRAGADREPIRELELELKSGDAAALFDLAHELAKSAPIRLSFDTKAERGYRLAGHDATAALKAERAALTPATPMAEAFRLSMRSCLTQIVGNAQLLRRVRSPQALHQTRVGLRRMRAVLSTFKPMVAGAGFDTIKAEAKWLAKALDRARDLDVFIQDTLSQDEDALQQDAAIAAFTDRLLSAQAEAYEQALAAIDSPRFAEFLLHAAAWVEIGAWSSTDAPRAVALRALPIADFAGRALQRLHRKLGRGGRGLKRLGTESRHHLRIDAKKLRYAVELFTDTFPEHPKRRARHLEALRDLQDRLGELNDLAVGGRLAVEVAGRRGAEAAFAAGLLMGRRSRGEAGLMKQAARAFDAFADAGRFWPKPAAQIATRA